LRQSIHSFAYLDVHIVIGCGDFSEFVFFDDFVWNVPHAQPYILISCHWCVEIEVGDVGGEESRVWGGDDTVEKDFCQ